MYVVRGTDLRYRQRNTNISSCILFGEARHEIELTLLVSDDSVLNEYGKERLAKSSTNECTALQKLY